MLKPVLKVKKGNPDFAAIKQKVDDMKTKVFDKMPTIAVGLPKNSTPYPDGTSVIMVGFWNEFGTQDGVVPSRPWLRTGANDNRDKWIAMARRIVKKCLQTGQNPLNHFALLGLQMEADIKNSIAAGEWEPNQGAYAAWKLSKGYTKPLMVTGHMRASVRYIIYGETKQ
jgi:hypothetical protein